MGSKKAPAAPPSPVSTADIQNTWTGATGDIDAASNNPYPMQAYQQFAPILSNPDMINQMVQGGNSWAAQGPQMFGYANQIMQEGFDPQNAVYNRAATNVQNQARAGQAARGVQISPYGAALEGENMGNFNLDWENNRLGRMGQAANTATQLWTGGGQAVQGGAQIPQNIATYAGMLQQLGMGAYAPQMWGAQNYAGLFGQGTAAQQGAYQNQLGQHNANQQASASTWGGIGKLAGQLGSAAIMASDRRLKTNIKLVDIDPRGWGVYEFEYHGAPEKYVGYMADEVELFRPEAVLTDYDGFKAVDYGAL